MAQRATIWLLASAMCAAAAVGQPIEAESPPPDSRWIGADEPFKALELDGQTLWRLDYDDSLTHIAFHPLALPGIGPLTVDAPPDHVHHHGLWFSWKYINGVNFWEHAPGSDRPAGRTVWTRNSVQLAKDSGEASFQFFIRYLIEGREVLTEARTISVGSPAEDGSYTIDWKSAFEAVHGEVKLDRTPLPDEPGGKVYGGYAGLSARLVQMDDRRAITTDGPVEFNDQDRYRGRHDAFEYSGTLNDKEVGIAILSHPDNVNSPSPWYAIRSGAMSFFTPAAICYDPLTLHWGQVVHLQYRVVVHPGRWTRGELAAAFEDYAGVAPTPHADQKE